MKFNDLLEKLESDGNIINFRFSKSQAPVYLIVRFMLIQSLINKEFKLSNLDIQKNNRRPKDIFMYIYYTLKLNVFFAPKKDIYIFSSGIVNNLQNSKYVNRLYDDFNTMYKAQTQIIESSTKYSYLVPKKEKIYFKDLINIIIVVSSKFIISNKKDLDMIDNFIVYLQSTNLFNNEPFLDEIKKILIKYSKKINISYSIYLYLLKLKKVKLIIVEDAHYFGNLALIKAAKSLGVTTAEYQHGYVGLAHPAYNYHSNIFEAIKEFLPEYFLTYGDYWSSVARTPSGKITIGLANLSNQLIHYNKVQNKKNKVLFISSGTTFEALNILIEKSLAKLNILGYEILLRPHPIESDIVKERYLNLIRQSVIIETSDLYNLLKDIDIVIGIELSTVLYEATCFTNKVYLMDTEYTRFYEPNFCFLPFKNENELIVSIQEERFIEYNSNYFWDSNWKLNYKKFIKGLLMNNDQNYQICTRCVMDTTDPEITFDANGVCNHCREFDEVTAKGWFPNEQGAKKLEAIYEKIKKENAHKEYDCILGLSGGVDSSYLALKLYEVGIRPLVVHVDGGWNSELAVANIENIINYCGWDLHTIVIDWEEMRDLQLAYLKSGIANQDVPQDHAFFASLYHFATKYGINYIISGGNIATEGIFPPSWLWSAMDADNLHAIHKKFGTQKLKNYKTIGFYELYFYYPFIKKMKTIRPLNFMPYIKSDALQELKDKIGYKEYDRKHGESVFTKFFQNYWLPMKFGYDKRKPHLSSLIVSGQISRDEALKELEIPLYDVKELQEDKEYIAKKLGVSDEEFEQILKMPSHNYSDFVNMQIKYKRMKKIQKIASKFLGRSLSNYS